MISEEMLKDWLVYCAVLEEKNKAALCYCEDVANKRLARHRRQIKNFAKQVDRLEKEYSFWCRAEPPKRKLFFGPISKQWKLWRASEPDRQPRNPPIHLDPVDLDLLCGETKQEKPTFEGFLDWLADKNNL